ncbi:MAG: hypothetical protein U0528_04975 [Anaerolineae bacterium]
MEDFRTGRSISGAGKEFNQSWDAEVQRIYNLEHEPLMQSG